MFSDLLRVKLAQLQAFTLVAVIVSFSTSATGEVVFNDESRPALSGDMFIPAEAGAIRGDNLFHSFNVFNINTGESATFTGPNDITRVIARVTGAGGTLIDGLLKSDIVQADFFLINPNGISLGNGASIDLDGGLYLSTANKLTFSDGSDLYVSGSGNSTLTVAAPEAFGFLDPSVAPINLENALISNSPGSTISLIGGDITILNSSIYVPDGNIEIVSVGGEGKIGLSPFEPGLAEGMNLGQIQVLNEAGVEAEKRIQMKERFGMSVADVDVSGPGGGRINLVSDVFEASGSFIFADTTEDGSGKGISVFTQSRMSLIERSRITTDSLGSGAAGNVELTSGGDIFLSGRSTIASDARGEGGDGGNLLIQANRLILESLSQIKTTTNTEGASGRILIDATSITLKSGGSIAGQTIGPGNGGDINLFATESVLLDGVSLENGIESGVSVNTLGPGSAGTINIVSPIVTLLNGASIKALSGGLTQNSGAAGVINIQSDLLQILSGSHVNASSFSSANAGNIEANSYSITIAGADSGIFSETLGSGNGGTIVLEASSFELGDLAKISVTTSAGGNAGEFTLTASEARLANSRIEAGTSGTGSGGRIEISSETLSIVEGANINTNTTSLGLAGEISLNIGDTMILRDEGSTISSRSGLGESGSFGAGGNIYVQANTISIDRKATIEATSSGTGFAGNVSLLSDVDILVSQQSAVRTNSENSGGGNINIEGVEKVIFDRSIVSASAGGENVGDDSGNISIDPVFLILRESSILAQANFGDGGAIFLSADNYIRDISSTVDASSQRGNDGEITISSPDVDVSGLLGVLSANFSSKTTLLRDPCAVKALQDTSSLIVEEKAVQHRFPTGYPRSKDSIKPSCNQP